MVDGLEPHGHIYSAAGSTDVHVTGWVGEGGVPGVWELGGYLEGYTGTLPDTLQDPYLTIFLR